MSGASQVVAESGSLGEWCPLCRGSNNRLHYEWFNKDRGSWHPHPNTIHSNLEEYASGKRGQKQALRSAVKLLKTNTYLSMQLRVVYSGMVVDVGLLRWLGKVEKRKKAKG